jgi:hypothetical protein
VTARRKKAAENEPLKASLGQLLRSAPAAYGIGCAITSDVEPR